MSETQRIGFLYRAAALGSLGHKVFFWDVWQKQTQSEASLKSSNITLHKKLEIAKLHQMAVDLGNINEDVSFEI